MADSKKDLGASSGSRERGQEVVPALTGFDPERIIRAFNARLNIYRTKRDESDPFGPDIYGRQGVNQLVVEAIEILALEAGLSAVVPHGDKE